MSADLRMMVWRVGLEYTGKVTLAVGAKRREDVSNRE
jgi:hypothetical protein